MISAVVWNITIKFHITNFGVVHIKAGTDGHLKICQSFLQKKTHLNKILKFKKSFDWNKLCKLICLAKGKGFW